MKTGGHPQYLQEVFFVIFLKVYLQINFLTIAYHICDGEMCIPDAITTITIVNQRA